MNPGASQFGDLATQLLTESRRSTATHTLLKYNDVLVRAVLREQRDLEARIEAALASAASQSESESHMPTVLLYQTAILRNKRCLLAYHAHRIDLLKDLYWAVGGALPLLLALPPAAAPNQPNANASAGAGDANPNAGGGGGGGGSGGAASASLGAAPQDVRSKLSPHEVDFLRSYAASLLTLRTESLAAGGGGNGTGRERAGAAEDVDVLAPITHPPKDLQVTVRVVRDCGVVHTELGAIDFRRGHRFLVRRADIEHLIVQGFLEES
ncbi:uncharacterized protein BXZ73DRAFT_91643 [Epithele typhae]|uniref:uncharacterized protein n=1 Tax=Epithele typhae TaxID=378194 RepID=UPI002007826B|nr:uncharacterized protein BXZ73DRAFT_91643 [Epithele typhae]KAH9921939.1 hypothetical protein BXZ73DRAFT_91643 [Epithele typhae]